MGGHGVDSSGDEGLELESRRIASSCPERKAADWGRSSSRFAYREEPKGFQIGCQRDRALLFMPAGRGGVGWDSARGVGGGVRLG